jgi:hypothetical protein
MVLPALATSSEISKFHVRRFACGNYFWLAAYDHQTILVRQIHASTKGLAMRFLSRFGVIFSLSAACAQAQTLLPLSVRESARRTARTYPLDSAYAFGADSIVLVFRDSALTPESERTGAWVFGPAATKTEADGCPPEKVLGRRITRAAWTELRRPKRLQMVIIRIRGPRVGDPLESMDEQSVDFYYPKHQLTGPWIGDRSAGRNKK